MVIIIRVLGGYVDGLYGYNLARPARCGTYIKVNDMYIWYQRSIPTCILIVSNI